jgi:hypothetical protein
MFGILEVSPLFLKIFKFDKIQENQNGRLINAACQKCGILNKIERIGLPDWHAKSEGG